MRFALYFLWLPFLTGQHYLVPIGATLTNGTQFQHTNTRNPVKIPEAKPRQINFFNWLFGDNTNVHKINTNTSITKYNNSATFISLNHYSDLSTTVKTHTVMPSITLHLNNATLDSGIGNISANSRRGERQLFHPPLFPYQIYTMPWNHMQIHPQLLPHFNNKRLQQPIYNIYDEDDERKTFETYENEDESEDDLGFSAQEEGNFPGRNQLIEIPAIEVVPYADRESTTNNDEIEDYDETNINRSDEDVFHIVKLLPMDRSYQNMKHMRIVTRSVEDSHTNSDSFHDRQKPKIWVKLAAPDGTTDQFSNVPVLSPNSTQNTSAPNTNDPISMNSTQNNVNNVSMVSTNVTGTNVSTPNVTNLSNPNGTNSSDVGSIGQNSIGNSSTIPSSVNVTGTTQSPLNQTIGGNETMMENLNSAISSLNLTTTLPPTTFTSEGNSSVASSLTPSTTPTTTIETTNGTTPLPVTGINNVTNVNSSTTTEATTMKPLPTISATLNCQCGVQSVSRETVGSTVMRVMIHPWLVEIVSKNRHVCAGSIINDNYVLTTANCVQGFGKKNLKVIAGLQIQNSKSKFFGISKVLIHPKYDSLTLANNIALLRLSERIKSSQSMRPICLPIHYQKKYYHTGIYFLWSTIHEPGSKGHLVTWLPNRKNLELLQTEVELLDGGMCQEAIGKNDVMRNSNGIICATPPGQKKCTGDIGGILQVYAGKYSYEQIGIVSKSVGCRTYNMPGIYTDIRHYIRWILLQTQDAHYCREPNSGSFQEN